MSETSKPEKSVITSIRFLERQIAFRKAYHDLLEQLEQGGINPLQFMVTAPEKEFDKAATAVNHALNRLGHTPCGASDVDRAIQLMLLEMNDMSSDGRGQLMQRIISANGFINPRADYLRKAASKFDYQDYQESLDWLRKLHSEDPDMFAISIRDFHKLNAKVK